MELRRVELDFSDAEVRWTPNEPEYAHLFNAVSSYVPYLEGMMNKAVMTLEKQLPAGAEGLRHDVRNFTWQEGRHARLHMQYNYLLQDAYPWLEAEQKKIRADFTRFVEQKGPKFTLAYSEGFETHGPYIARYFFEDSGGRLSDWDQPSVYLWLWHFAEEYEHRTVCNHLFHELYGSYWYRLYGIMYATIHLFSYVGRVSAKMARWDRVTGEIPDVWPSRLRRARAVAGLGRVVVPGLLKALHPRYDPAEFPAPRRSMELLAEASRKYGVREPS